MKNNVLHLFSLSGLFTRIDEIATAMATRSVALTPEAAKKKFEAVSEGTTLGIDCSIISRVTTPRIVPIKNPNKKCPLLPSHLEAIIHEHANRGRMIKCFWSVLIKRRCLLILFNDH